MKDKKYKLEILPLFEDDLNEIVQYISVNLMNPNAAGIFVDKVEHSILKRLECPEVFSHFPHLSKFVEIF